nr:hypothetical protein [Natronolimnohabitans innermongolicus]
MGRFGASDARTVVTAAAGSSCCRPTRLSGRGETTELGRASRHDARFGNGTPDEIKSTVLEHSDGQPGNLKIYREYHEKLRRANGWDCFVVYRPRGRSGCTVVQDKMGRSSDLPLLRWRGGGDHRGTKQAKIGISDIF